MVIISVIVIQRKLEEQILSKLNLGKAVVLFGARQTGKTTLLKKILPEDDQTLWLYGDNSETHQMLSSTEGKRFKSLFSRYKTIVIDEAQNLNDIGRILKIFVDQLPEIQLVAAGSSSFDLANKTSEPLTGRKWEFKIFPLSFSEMVDHHGLYEELGNLNQRLLFGYYPEVVQNPGQEKELLKLISDSYLYKDLLIWSNIRHSDILVKLLRALALQLGSEVSYHELSRTLQIDRGTVERYIDVLEKSFVVFRLSSLNRNYRKELKKGKKIYFFDNGIRNAIIANFAPLDLRTDKGALWENFLVSERIKKLNYDGIWSNSYFWRTTSQVEIDYIEERDGRLMAYEFKWKPASKGRKFLPPSFAENYPESSFEIITSENVEEFLL